MEERHEQGTRIYWRTYLCAGSGHICRLLIFFKFRRRNYCPATATTTTTAARGFCVGAAGVSNAAGL